MRTLTMTCLLAACSGSIGGDGGLTFDGGPRPDAPFERPDAPLGDGGTYEPQPGSCGFDSPAFCDNFEAGPMPVSRSGELDAAHWSVLRAMPTSHVDLGDATPIGPAWIESCRPDVDNTRQLPDHDSLICDPSATIGSRYLMTASTAQNYGLNTYRIRQPFDFTGRTGTIKVDMAISGDWGWPAIVIAADPSPAPSFDWEERGSGPRNGIEIEFNGGTCNQHNVTRPQIFEHREYVQINPPETDGCGQPVAQTAPGALNHVEIYINQTHLEVWASDVSTDGGNTFPNFQMLYAGDVNLSFTRGYVSLVGRNHATIKYWTRSAWMGYWDNVGFDGPTVSNWRESSVPDSLTVTHGLPGCMIDGACQWRPDTIAAHPGDDSVCPPTAACSYDGEGRNVGYVVPNSDETPARIEIPAVSITGATRARLIVAGDYPWFEWNGNFPPPTALALHYRLNGGDWHDRYIDEVEANAFGEYSTGVGGVGLGAGLLNQAIELDLAELIDGTNVLEVTSLGTWTGSYRAEITAIDLVMETGP